jgi:hypothetical protein
MKMGGKTYNTMWKTHGETVREMIALHFWLFFHFFFGYVYWNINVQKWFGKQTITNMQEILWIWR